MNQMICTAIQSRLVIEFDYDGGPRKAEPHCHGTSRAGNEVVRAFQTEGFSNSGITVGWKLFEVSRMKSLYVTNATFPSNRQGYNPNDEHMSPIHCRV